VNGSLGVGDGTQFLDIYYDNAVVFNISDDLIINGGNVGIGTTTSPGAKLEVDGNVNVTSGNDVCITSGNCLSSVVPSGMIAMFNSSCPSGWTICNGNAGTPNLINKFIRAETSAGNIGGDDTMAHTHSVTSNVAVATQPTFNGPYHTHGSGTLYSPLHFDNAYAYYGTSYDRNTFTAYRRTNAVSYTASTWTNTPGYAIYGSTGGGGTGECTRTTNVALTNNAVTSGAASNTENRPAYYSLVFCMKT